MSKAPPFERKDGSTLTVQREGKLGEGGREGKGEGGRGMKNLVAGPWL